MKNHVLFIKIIVNYISIAESIYISEKNIIVIWHIL